MIGPDQIPRLENVSQLLRWADLLVENLRKWRRSEQLHPPASVSLTAGAGISVAPNPITGVGVISSTITQYTDAMAVAALGATLTGYTKLAGRAGVTNDTTLSNTIDGTLAGSTLTGKNLILRPNTADLTTGELTAQGLLHLFTTFPNVTSGAGIFSAARFDPSITYDDNTGGRAIRCLDISPTITHTTGLVPSFAILGSNAVFINRAFPFIYVSSLFQSSMTLRSDVNGIEPLLQDCYVDGTTVEQTVGASTSPWSAVSFLSQMQIRANGADTSLTLDGTKANTLNGLKSSAAGVFFHPTLRAWGTVGHNATMIAETIHAVYCVDPTLLTKDSADGTTGNTVGTVSLNDYGAVDVGPLTQAINTNYAVRSKVAGGTNRWFVKDDGGAQAKFSGVVEEAYAPGAADVPTGFFAIYASELAIAGTIEVSVAGTGEILVI